jgi:hypothetical protein
MRCFPILGSTPSLDVFPSHPSISRWDGPLASARASARRSLYQSQEWLVSAAALLQLSSRLLVTARANTSRPRHHTSDTTHSHLTLCSAHTHSTLRCRPLRHNRHDEITWMDACMRSMDTTVSERIRAPLTVAKEARQPTTRKR